MTGLRPRLAFDRYAELIEQEARRLADDLRDADLSIPVPSCPDWNLAQLTQHVGAELPWVEGMVRARAAEMAGDSALRLLDPAPDRDAATTADRIAEGGATLAAALREVTTDTPMWSPFPGEEHAGFHARRFAHEGALHRADAALALGRPFAVETDAALDAVAEWMEHGQHPVMSVHHPERASLLGPGRVLRVEIDDVGEDADASWLVDLRGAAPRYVPATHGDADEVVAARAKGSVLDVLLVLYRRRASDVLAVEGDRALLDEWLAGCAFA